MRRFPRRGVLAALVVVVVAVAFLVRFSGGNAAVPTITVAEQSFIQRVTAEGQLRAVRATPLAAPMQQGPMRIAYLVEDGTRVAAGELVARFDPTKLEGELEAGTAESVIAQARLRSTVASAETSDRNLDRDASIAARELEVATGFQSTDAEIFSRFEIIESEIDTELARARLRRVEAVRPPKSDLATAERTLQEIQDQRARLKIDHASRGLAELEVRAPYDGIVLLQRDWRGNPTRVGTMVWPGRRFAEIPDLGEMEVELFVLEADAGGLASGQQADVTLESQPGVTIPGVVTRVEALAKPRWRGSPVQFFTAVVSLQQAPPDLLKPGQRVTVTVTLVERNKTVAIPRRALFERDDRPVVFVRIGRGRFQATPVTLGPGARGWVVVESGLAPGDIIATVDPEAAPEARPAAGNGIAVPGGGS